MEQTGLGTQRTPARLGYADHMNRLVASDGAPSSPEGAKMLTRADPALDRPMILFQDVIEILHGGVGNCQPDRLRLGARQWRVDKRRACRY